MNATAIRPSAAPLVRILALLAALCLTALAAGCSQGPEQPAGQNSGQNSGQAKDLAQPGSGADESAEGKLVLYACPMNDIPPLPAPGKCPVCGMELAPVIAGDAEPGAAARSRLDPAQMQLAGVRTAPVEKRYATATVQLYGQVEYDDAFISDIRAPANGIVDRVYVRRVGEFIRRDQPLFDFFSSDIEDLENQLLEMVKVIPQFVASQLGAPINPALRGAAGPPPDPQQVQDAQRRFILLRSRLYAYGLLDRDINQVLRLEQLPGVVSVRMPSLTSQVGGVVIENNAVEGSYVNKGTLLAKIADPHFAWVNFDAFEHDYPWLRIGQLIEFSTPARPGEVFTGKISSIKPTFDEKNRTFRVGVGYNDYSTLLRPNMTVRGSVKALLDKEGRPAKEGTAPERAPLVIPESAPLVTGKRAVVYVAVPDKPGVFEGREIVLGPKADGVYVVLAGLAEGEQVVVDGAFKLDSERQILAKPSMLKPEGLVRLQDFGTGVAPPPTPRTGGYSERPRGPSPAPDFPPAEIFSPNRNIGAAPSADPVQPGAAAGQPAAKSGEGLYRVPLPQNEPSGE